MWGERLTRIVIPEEEEASGGGAGAAASSSLSSSNSEELLPAAAARPVSAAASAAAGPVDGGAYDFLGIFCEGAAAGDVGCCPPRGLSLSEKRAPPSRGDETPPPASRSTADPRGFGEMGCVVCEKTSSPSSSLSSNSVERGVRFVDLGLRAAEAAKAVTGTAVAAAVAAAATVLRAVAAGDSSSSSVSNSAEERAVAVGGAAVAAGLG